MNRLRTPRDQVEQPEVAGASSSFVDHHDGAPAVGRERHTPVERRIAQRLESRSLAVVPGQLGIEATLRHLVGKGALLGHREGGDPSARHHEQSFDQRQRLTCELEPLRVERLRHQRVAPSEEQIALRVLRKR